MTNTPRQRYPARLGQPASPDPSMLFAGMLFAGMLFAGMLFAGMEEGSS